MEVTKGNSYLYSQLQKLAKENDYEFKDIDDITATIDLIGASFVILVQNNIIISFVLTGTVGDEYVYECIYKDA